MLKRGAIRRRGFGCDGFYESLSGGVECFDYSASNIKRYKGIVEATGRDETLGAR